jgi:O-antigen biosynthesis protein
LKLSIIIVNYNVEYFLEQCLNSVKSASKNLETEIFVVDNNSIDDSVVMVQSKFPEVLLIANKENTGFSKANNQAMRIAKGEYVLLLNPDTVVEEDTFNQCIEFMDTHSDSGGLGVEMLDGKGKFLPESKRGLPTPSVAFYKISGLSSLFPRSKKFGKYHLGYLPQNETNEIEILSGAFMLMRKTVLDKVGLLDEDFFMYGEDIDLSYRIILGGYKNYYFPKTRIIHYKGESTKKSSVNYVFVFYNAMVIFAKKHFSEKNAKSFSVLINLAIYLRASMAITTRFFKKSAFPLLDFCLVLASIFGITIAYQLFSNKEFPLEVIAWALPIYSFVWVLVAFLSGAHDRPIKPVKSLIGAIIGTALILIIYGLLPKSVQFSRIIILLGAMGTTLSLLFSRFVLHIIGFKGFEIGNTGKKRFVIIGEKVEAERIHALLTQTTKVGYKAILSVHNNNSDDYDGTLNQLEDFIHINKIDEVIFCAKDISAQQIIEQMATIKSNREVDYKIAQPDSLFLIGSNSINTAGDLYLLDVNSIDKPNNKRKKRILDVCSSLIFLSTFPLLIFVVKSPVKFLENIFSTLFGEKTWVGYSKQSKNQQLPLIKNGIISLLDNVKIHSPEIERKLNLIYAKDYALLTDFKTISKNIKKLGN